MKSKSIIIHSILLLAGFQEAKGQRNNVDLSNIDQDRRRDTVFPWCRDPPSFNTTAKPQKIVSFLTMGDVPYSLKERYCLNHQLRELRIGSKGAPSFMIHVGDIKDGKKSSACDFNAYNDVAKLFSHSNNALNYDTRDLFFVPGDNEWNDCQYLDESWRLWMDHFGPKNSFGFGQLSKPKVKVARQSTVERAPGVDRSENFAFFLKKVLFIGVNIVGSDDMGDEDVRLVQNFNWTKAKLEQFSKRGMRAAVIFGHAAIRKKGAKRDFYGAPLFRLLRESYPDLPVLYNHGDWHDFCPSYPDPLNPNFVDLEVDAGYKAPPVLITVLRNPEDGKIIFDMDQRGGSYGEAGCPEIAEVTWDPAKPVPGKTEIQYKANNPPNDAFPLGECEGDCDSDDECDQEQGLLCFFRDYNETIPGCYGATRRGKDYCFRPPWIPRPQDNMTTTIPTVQPTPAPTQKPTITPTASPIKSEGDLPELTVNKVDEKKGRCEANCKNDNSCQPGLLCYKRKAFEPVPGCSGVGKQKKDYCYDPKYAAAASPAETNPTQSPQSQPKPVPGVKELVLKPTDKRRGLCEGPCNRDAHCKPTLGLKCFERESLEPVPGCSGSGVSGKNYCFDPSAQPVRGDLIQPTREPSGTAELEIVTEGTSLGLCQGNCKRTADCAFGLKCFKRSGDEEVPGCVGKARSGKDYCYDPNSVSRLFQG